MYVPRANDRRDSTGFLGLDSRLSIVRTEAISASGDLDQTPRPRRLLVVLSNPTKEDAHGWKYDELNVGQERIYIDDALRDIPGISVDFRTNLSADSLGKEITQKDVDIFHFSGHGSFEVTGYGPSIWSVVGKGAIVLVGQHDEPELMFADQLAVNLLDTGVQLVFLGACQTGRRDELNIWSGVAASLAEIPSRGRDAVYYRRQSCNMVQPPLLPDISGWTAS